MHNLQFKTIRLPFSCRMQAIQQALIKLVGTNCKSLWIVLLAALVTACEFSGYESYSGSTMGTYYRIVADCQKTQLSSEITDALNSVEAHMSNYRSDSTVQQFNRSPEETWIEVDDSLVYVVSVADEVSELTSGRFDITIEPLVSAWGFGASTVSNKPSNEEIEEILKRVDYRALEFRSSPPGLRKRHALTIDLSGIAKGYGVDVLADLLDQSDCKNYLVEIGGELRVKGLNQMGHSWRIGIENPSGSGGANTRVLLTQGSIATTGDYRNFRVFDGETLPHVLDASTGYPVDHSLASVTVHMPTATEADAIATALYVMGEEGFELASSHGIAALFISWNESTNQFDRELTSEMESLLDE